MLAQGRHIDFDRDELEMKLRFAKACTFRIAFRLLCRLELRPMETTYQS
jgi:hypothetical protein